MKDQHTPIKGYRNLTQAEIDLINRIKSHAEKTKELVAELRALPAADLPSNAEQPVTVLHRWASIGETHLQQGFMALVRAVGKPKGF